MKDIIGLFRLTRPYGGTYATALVTLAIGTGAFLLIPTQLGRLIESLRHVEDGSGAGVAGNAAMMGAALLAIHAVAAFTYSFLTSVVSERIVNGLRSRFFSSLVHRRLDMYPAEALGQVASEFASDLSLIQDGLSTALIDTVRHSLVVCGALTGLFLISYKMTWLALLGVCGVAAAVTLFIRRATASIMFVQQMRATVMSLLLEAASNAYIIQAYGRAAYMTRRFDSSLSEMFVRIRRQLFLMACMSPICLVLFAAVMAGLGVYGVQQVRAAQLTVAMLVSYFTLAALLVASIGQMAHLIGRLRQAGAILAKHQETLTGTQQAAAGAGPAHSPRRAASTGRPFGFEVSNVTFGYPGKQSPAILDVSFSVPAGQVTAIVGESGSGKSTMAAMLCGLYQPRRGSIRLLTGDGVDADLSGPSSSAIAIVPQEPFLFAGTILDNITFGREGITDAQAHRAADVARIHGFITSLRDGYDTRLDEAGKNLSRGQRQRIAIARALVGNPSVIIMDEATASLDVVSERAIKAAIDDLRGRVTFVIIAHQGALLSNVDHCVTLRGGTVQSTAALRAETVGVLC